MPVVRQMLVVLEANLLAGTCRCFAIPKGAFTKGDPRSRETTAQVKATYSKGDQWDTFGISGDVVVRI